MQGVGGGGSEFGLKGHGWDRMLEGQDEEVQGRKEEGTMPERLRRALREYAEKRFQGDLASHSGGMFSSEGQVTAQPLASAAIWKVQMGKRALAH